MFRSISQGDTASLKKLCGVFLRAGRKTAALLAFDHVFSRLPVLKSRTLPKMSQFLHNFQKYVHLVLYIIEHDNPLSVASIMRLFCISDNSNVDFNIRPATFLHRSATGDQNGPLYRQWHSIITLFKGDMVKTLRKYLAEHLRKRVTKENNLCRDALAFTPCLTFIVNGHCEQDGCTREHIKSTNLNSRYNLRIIVHLKQIYVLELMYSVDHEPHLNRRSCVLEWLAHLYEAFNPQSHIIRSNANLDLSTIHAAHKSTMKRWVRNALCDLRPSHDPPTYLTTIVRLTSLLFAFDESHALKCIEKAGFNGRETKVQEYMYPDGRCLLADMVDLFDGTKPTCISAGLSFLRHIIQSSLSIDLSVLCDCLELVICKICISWRLSNDPPLDGLVLPRSWLSSHRDFSQRDDLNIPLLVDLLVHVQELLNRLQYETANRRIYTLLNTTLTAVLCNIFTSRICRALCFLVFNVQDSEVRQKVKDIFNVMQTASPTARADPLYQKYLHAHLDEYMKTLSEYDAKTKGVIMDLVELLHEHRDPTLASPLALPRIMHIWFEDPSDLPASSPSAAAPSNESGHLPDLQMEQKIQPEPKVEPVKEVYEEPQELASDEPTMLTREQVHIAETSAAAEKIQAAYRGYRTRSETIASVIRGESDMQRNAIFIICLKNVYASGWERTAYRTVYLWAFPRLVACLDMAISIARKFKNKTISYYLKSSHERLEQVAKQMRMTSALLKNGHKLRKMIDPNADMHQEKDMVKMRQVASDIKVFLDQLPSPAPDLQKDFDVACRLLIAKQEKTTFNTERSIES